MSTHQANYLKPWIGILVTHNPFYVISAVLTLYGLSLSFGDNIDPTRGWLQLQLLIGYMLMLAGAGVLVVRLGQVWEDARSLFLLVLLMMVALSVSFDRICLDNVHMGMLFLGLGLTFSLVLCESLLFALKIRLPWTYRSVLYLQLAILFCYPSWLGHLSLDKQLTKLAWYVLGFPTIAAGSMVLLLPAMRRREQVLQNNGTPWSWPWYPWTIFVVLGIGIVIRTLTITFSFDPTRGFNSGIQPYFLIPLMLSWILLWAENGFDRNNSRPCWRFILVPFGLFALSLPGMPESVVQARYLNLLQDSIGSPIQITAVLLIFYSIYLLLKGLRTAEWGLLATLGVLSFVDSETLDINTFTELNPTPALAGILLLFGSATLHRSTGRLCIATLGVMAAISYATQETWFTENRGFISIHLTFVLVLLANLFFDDMAGRLFRRFAGKILTSVGMLTLVSYRHLFPDASSLWFACYVLCLSAIATVFWKRNGQFHDLVSILVCLLVAAGHLIEYFVGDGLKLVFLQGKKWLVWGVLFFLIGLIISFIKGGQLRRLRRILRHCHIASLRSTNDH